MQTTNKGMRLHIGIYGRRNAGKSSLLNALTRQDVSIVSEIAGTTTDPVEKPMELLPLGPVLFIDTAGLDDDSVLGKKRVEKTIRCFERTDLGLVVATDILTQYEEHVIFELESRNIPFIIIFNKVDISRPDKSLLDSLSGRSVLSVSAKTGEGMDTLRETIVKSAPEDYLSSQSLLADLVGPQNTAILVIPIDKEAPKGRIILPQMQAIRDLLDNDACAIVVKENGLAKALSELKTPPKLVVTDSQAFKQVAAIVPESIPMTGFSVLLSRQKGDLMTQVVGAVAIDNLHDGERVLIAEACTHHPIGDDIGRVKIPKWLETYCKCKLKFTTYQGHDFPSNLTDYKLVILCGSCMQNRREVLSRLMHCRNAGIPVTNYGLAIAFSLGLLERALSPFPEVLSTYKKSKHG